MKRFLTLAILATMAWACSTKSTEQTELTKLVHERDSLAALQSQVGNRLRELEVEIMAQDTMSRLTAVTTLPLQTTTFKHFFNVYGTIEAAKSISLYPESSGTILNILVNEGQTVAAGQLLAELDDKVLEKNIAEVQTNLDLANTIYQKQKKLWEEERIGSEVQYLEAKANKEGLESRLASLKQQQRMTKVRAPFSGVIDEIFPKVGEMANPAQPLLRLVNLSEVYISADVSEAYVGTITKGTVARVSIGSLDKTFDSKIVQVGQFINPNNRTFKVHVGLDDGGKNEFKPNMMASVEICDYTADSAIVVPNSLLQQTPQGHNFVYVINPLNDGLGKVERVVVEVGQSHNEQTEVRSGLTANQILVNKGSRSIKVGQTVKISND
jgi:RND family efflux transporter MFP subunit